MFTGYIYKYTDIKTNKIYIGQTVKPVKQRDSEHKSCKTNNLFNNTLQKHPSDFILDTIDTICCDDKNELVELLNCLEEQYIKLYDCLYPKGYNLTSGGNSRVTSDYTRNKRALALKGRHRTQETKIKLSELNKGKKHSEETKRKISESNKGSKNHFYGKHHSKATKKILSEKAKVRCCGAGNPMFGEPSWNRGKTTPDNVKKKISEANKGNKSLTGRHWCNNGIINKTYIDIMPEGFIKGKIRGVKKQ